MRLIFIFLGLVATSVFAHQVSPHDAKQPGPSRETMRTQTKPSIRKDESGDKNVRQADKAHSDGQRFCVKNSIGKVNCVVLPGGGH